jgi:serine/threonine-protein phosphatase 2A regulatory subunit A
VNTAQWEFLPILLEARCNLVPNVRFNVAKGLGTIGPMFNPSVYKGQIVTILEVLKEDADRDVRYFANISSDSLSAEFEKR